MPRVIRQAFGERLRKTPELQSFLADFRRATGVTVSYVGPLGRREDEPAADCTPLCARLRQVPAGCRMCARFQQSLLDTASQRPATQTCAAGLTEAVVPMRAAGQTVGFLATGGYFAATPDTAQLNRARHLLEREGVALPAEEIERLTAATPVVPVDRQAALENLLTLAAEHLTARLTDRLTPPETTMPELVQRACAIVHSEYAQEITVPAVARRLAVSEGHLSRTFHHTTGLRLVEYIARYRAERARALLSGTDQPVTEIAFACGFQSLSQFNRVFRAQFGTSPRELRGAA